ncbi:virginiamycin B lyase family protein [Actinomycetospora sp. CA-101289]|uniref:Vgb family protein n=1 Tax=Actinomycetospora sp. CA-101289 TaxID=3239893 RepID=UPI003D99AFE7
MRGDIEVVTDGSGGVDQPTGVIGAFGEVWFTSIANGRIGRVVGATRQIETFADPAGGVALPANLFPGADGRLWFTCLGSNRLGALDPRAPDIAASIRTYADPRLDKPVALKAGPDRRLWLTLRGSASVGAFDPTAPDPLATLRTFTAPSIAEPSALFVHPDGGVWWVNAGTGTLGALDSRAPDPTTTIRSFGPWPGRGTPRAWAMDSEGRLWVTTQDRPGLLAFDPRRLDGPEPFSWWTDDRLGTPDGVWLGGDGAVWAVDTARNAIVRYDPRAAEGQRWSSFGAPPQVQGPFDIKSPDPADGWLWFTNKDGNSLARIRTA